MDVKLLVRDAQERDLVEIEKIENLSFIDPWTPNMLLAELRDPKSYFIVAEIEDVVVGYCCAENIAKEFNIMNIAVNPDFRKHGIGGILLDHLIDFAKHYKLIGITLEVRVSNDAAKALYLSRGFRTEGVRRGYYANGEDADIMWLTFEPITLAIETSCDETSCAILSGKRHILANEIHSQIDLHKLYGGVVPEIASRNHLSKISDVVNSAMAKANIKFEDIDLVAVTRGPGLVGALLVGLTYAKSLAYALGKPFIGIHHIEGHISANYISSKNLKAPFLCLVVSGGHTHLVDVRSYTEFVVLGRTLDDAVGEAYDKVARVLGLGYPGGPVVDRLAREGKTTISFPKAKVPGLDFSLSGLKTAVLNYINSARQKGEELNIPDICASFQETVVDMLRTKSAKALEQTGYKQFAIAGGVAANSRIREALHFKDVTTYYPPISLCTDNAAMIAVAAYRYYQAGFSSPMDTNASPTIKIGESFRSEEESR